MRKMTGLAAAWVCVLVMISGAGQTKAMAETSKVLDNGRQQVYTKEPQDV